MLNRKTNLLGLGIVSLLLMLSACTKPCDKCNVPAEVVDQGPVETDGCGWTVKIANVYYHVGNLPSAYKINGLAVKISYLEDTTAHYRCGVAGMPMPTAVIGCIER